MAKRKSYEQSDDDPTPDAKRSKMVGSGRSGRYRRRRSVHAIQQSGSSAPSVAKNKASLYALAKQVASLKREQAGPLQSNYTWLNVNGTSGNTFFTNCCNTAPFHILLNDMRYNAAVYKAQWDTNNRRPQSTPDYLFYKVPDPTPVGETEGATENFSFHTFTRDDLVNQQRFSPVKTKLEFVFQMNNAKVEDKVVWLRLDLVRQKKVLVPTTTHQLVMPNAAFSLGSSALNSTTGQPRNYIDPKFFEIIETKWVKMHNPQEVIATTGRTIVRRCSMTYKFDEGLVHDLSAQNPVTTSTGNVSQTPLSNIPLAEQVWCLLQSSAGPTDATVSCQIYRRNHWRDLQP